MHFIVVMSKSMEKHKQFVSIGNVWVYVSVVTSLFVVCVIETSKDFFSGGTLLSLYCFYAQLRLESNKILLVWGILEFLFSFFLGLIDQQYNSLEHGNNFRYLRYIKRMTDIAMPTIDKSCHIAYSLRSNVHMFVACDQK